MQDVIGELRRYVTGWLHEFGLSDTYSALLELAHWVSSRGADWAFSLFASGHPQTERTHTRSVVSRLLTRPTPSDRGTDTGAEDTRMDEAARKCRFDGKHGVLGERFSDRAVRCHNRDRLIGTAPDLPEGRDGPARRGGVALAD